MVENNLLHLFQIKGTKLCEGRIMNGIVVSVIIPTFNAEKYISNCIQSVLKDRGVSLEIIVVDDGSTDETVNIVKKYMNSNNHIKLLLQKHSGVTCARIKGLYEATGKYIGFVDGDDSIKEGMFSFLYNHIEENSGDIILNQSYYRVCGRDESVYSGGVEEGIYNINDGTLEKLYNQIWDYKSGKGILPNIWCNLYKKNIAIKAMTEMPSFIGFGEDELFMFSILKDVQKVIVINEPLYKYFYRDNSVCNTVNKHYLRDINYKYDYLINYYKGHMFEDLIVRQIEKKTLNEILSFRFLRKRGFEIHMFPYEKILAGTKLIIYGAGQVGYSYFNQIRVNRYCQIVAMCDERYEEINREEVVSPDILSYKENFEYVLIALLDYEMAKEIKMKLCKKYLLDKNIVIVHRPLSLLNYMGL